LLVRPPVYRSDSDTAPDADFEAGEYRHVVPGNRGRLLDDRRTPVTVTALALTSGMFEVRIDAFEDEGAHWELPIEDIGRFQFARGGAVAGAAAVTGMVQAVERFDRELTIECSPPVRDETLERIRTERERVRKWLAQRDVPRIDLTDHIARREGHTGLFALLEECMQARGSEGLERELTRTWVSNPASGEIVKGHAIVLAELGLCPYVGKIVRDPDLFAAPRSKTERATHLIARLAFMQALWSSWGSHTITLYRGAAVDGPLPARSRASLVSATFSRDIAEAHYEGGPATQTAVLWRQRVPIERVLMTFLETPEMNARFSESEAVLIADPSNRAF
jgi:hypothetical protein